MTPRIDRLKVLADYLENEVADERFDIRHWRCGTAACAMGHACNIREFQLKGLTMAVDSNTPVYFDSVEIHLGMAASAKFFNIHEVDAACLFDSASYENDPKNRTHVIRRIREFIARSETAKEERGMCWTWTGAAEIRGKCERGNHDSAH